MAKASKSKPEVHRFTVAEVPIAETTFDVPRRPLPRMAWVVREFEQRFAADPPTNHGAIKAVSEAIHKSMANAIRDYYCTGPIYKKPRSIENILRLKCGLRRKSNK
jgi:hypothetical protein